MAHEAAASKVGVRQALAPVTALLVGVALLFAGYGLQGTLVPLRADAEGFDRVFIGLLGSAYYMGFVLGCLFVPYLILRSGHIRSFAALMACLSAAILAFPLVVGPMEWLTLRLLIGVCISGLLVIVESWLNEKSTNETRGTVMSAYIIINYGAIVVGQLGVTLQPLTSYALFAICSIVLSLAAVPVALTRASQPAPVPVVAFRPRRLFNTAPAAFAGIFVAGIMTGSVFSLATIYAIDIGFTTDEAALFISAIILGGAVGQYPFGRLSDFMDRRLVLLAVTVGAGAAALVIVAVSGGAIQMVLAAGFLYGLLMLPGYSLAAAHAYDWTEPENMVETSAGLILLFGVGSVIGPIAASSLSAVVGISGLFVLHAAAAGVLATWIAARLFARRRPDDAMRGDFDIYSTAPVGGPLTPEPLSLDDAFVEAPANYTPSDPDSDVPAQAEAKDPDPFTLPESAATPHLA